MGRICVALVHALVVEDEIVYSIYIQWRLCCTRSIAGNGLLASFLSILGLKEARFEVKTDRT